jgi:hypothetical protein
MGSFLSLTEFFKIRLGAPLINTRQSWGAYKSDQSAVYLAVWQDEIKRVDGVTWVNVLGWGDIGSTFGREERIKHLDSIKEGMPAFALIKAAKDVKANPREMKEFNADYVIAIKNHFRQPEGEMMQVELGERVLI